MNPFQLFCVLFALHITFCYCACDSNSVLKEWKSHLIKRYDTSPSPTLWEVGSRNIFIFHKIFVGKLSELSKSCNEPFYFASIGACDGTSDKAIELFYQNKHWNGVFVEAYPPNIGALNEKLNENNAMKRALVLSAAAMEHCTNSTIYLRTPSVDFNNTQVRHWIRRQSAHVPSEFDMKRKRYKIEKMTPVPCLSGKDILESFDNKFSFVHTRKNELNHRAYLLKIDIEGTSVSVMRSMLVNEIDKLGKLPLIIQVEVKTAQAKGISDECCLTTHFLIERGYDVSPCGQDIYAFLKPDFM
eukprot:TRINITY_DN80416_c0_g1_i1.p1 TRINITY_DN80416_c0_g1~~TRINITY_DN80416_c0_g1_i1.p1  ORF type:complete len:300 (-),score=-32.00 TRINITY_DN80416_c0_g1_i1:57-956(-)